MNITIMGIDLAKNIFHLHGVDKRGKEVFSKALTRAKFQKFLSQLPPCLIGMEACGSSHYWARELKKRGHTVKIMDARFVKPYIKSNKNDRNDAEAICEAVQRPHMRFVPDKTIEQQDVQSLHRIRQRLVRRRTALTNEMRGLLGEYGIILPRNIQNVRNKLIPAIEDEMNEGKLTDFGKSLFRDLYEELVEIDSRIMKFDNRIGVLFKNSEECQRVSCLEGIGPITATAVVSACSSPGMFKNGREFSAWLGLVPRQKSSGGKVRLLGISKRGDSYLRSLLIHGARSVVKRVPYKKDKRSRWISGVEKRSGRNKAVVALANKNARIIWALLNSGTEYIQGGGCK